MIDFNLIKKLIQIVKDENITGLAIEDAGTKYEIRKELGGVVPTVSHVQPSNAPITAPKPESQKKEEEDGLVSITSPMVGTFYRTPSPDSPPFIEVGDQITPGKVVCIIEAMKLFNEIESEVSGKIVKILVENGKPVEYGQKLMLVKKE